MQVDCQVSILTPFDNITKTVSNQVLLVEHIIIGKFPKTYYNIDGMNKDNVLEVIE